MPPEVACSEKLEIGIADEGGVHCCEARLPEGKFLDVVVSRLEVDI